MATGTNTTIKVNLDSSQLDRALVRLERSWDRLNKRLIQNQKTTKKTNSGANKLSDQGLANMQAGLVQLSTYLMNVNQTINNVFDKMKTKFIEADSAMVRLRITMGIAGEDEAHAGNSIKARFLSYKGFEKDINRYAETTEYTKKQVADAFSSLIQSGRSAEEAMTQLVPTLQLTTASMGQLGLSEAIQLADLQMTTLGGNVNDTSKNFGMLLRMTQKTKISFRDLEGVMSSLKGAQTRFGETIDNGTKLSKPAEMMALAGVVRRMGLGAKESGQKVEQFTRTIASMYNTARKGELYLHKGKGTSKPRFSLKRQDLLNFFGVGRDAKALKKVGLQYGYELDQIGNNINAIQDEFLKRQLMRRDAQTGKFEQLGATELIERLTEAYRDLVDLKGEGGAKAIAQQAFGQEAGAFVLSAVVDFEAKGKKGIREFIKEIMKDNEELRKAQEEALKSLENKLKVLASAEDALSETLMKQDVMTKGLVESYTAMVSTATAVLRENESLAGSITALGRSMQIATSIGTKLGFALVASATFSIALAHSSKIAGGAITGLSGIMKSFYSVFLAPTVRVLFLMSGGLFAVGLGIVALMKHFSDAKSIGEGFSELLGTIKNKIMDTSYALKLMFSDKFKDKGAGEILKNYRKMVEEEAKIRNRNAEEGSPLYKSDKARLQELTNAMTDYSKVIGEAGTKRIAHDAFMDESNKIIAISDKLKSVYNGLRSVAEGALGPMASMMGFLIDGLKLAFYTLVMPITFVLNLLGVLGGTGDDTSKVLEMFGWVLGWLLGIFGAFKIVMMVVFMFKKLGATVTGAFTRIASAEARLATQNRKLTTSILQNASEFDKLRLKLMAVKGDTTKLKIENGRLGLSLTNNEAQLGFWGQALDRAKMKMAGFGAGLNKIGRGVKGLGGKLALLEGALLSVGMGMTLFGVDTEKGFGKTIYNLVTGLSLLIPLLVMVGPLLWKGAGAMYAFLGPIIMANIGLIAIIAGLTALFGALGWFFDWFGDDKEVAVTKKLNVNNGNKVPSALSNVESTVASSRTYNNQKVTINVDKSVSPRQLEQIREASGVPPLGSNLFDEQTAMGE